MISTGFVGARVFLHIGNHEFEVKVPYSLAGGPDAPEHCAEFLWTKLKGELEDAFEAGATYGSYAFVYQGSGPAPTFEEYLAGA